MSQAGRKLELFPPSAILCLLHMHLCTSIVVHVQHFCNSRTSLCINVQGFIRVHPITVSPKGSQRYYLGTLEFVWYETHIRERPPNTSLQHPSVNLWQSGSTFCRENCKLMARWNTQRLRGCWVAKPHQMPPASPLSLHATTVEVEVMVMVMVLVMVVVAVTVSPVPVVVSVTTRSVGSVLPLSHPCKHREATKPKQMAANARTTCMITRLAIGYQKQMRFWPLPSWAPKQKHMWKMN